MKKFSIKSLLVLVLALVLALSMILVACNKDEEPEEEVGYTASEYFTRLWDLSKSIGNEEIKENQNIAVSADLGVVVAAKNANNAVTKQVSVGIAIDAVLDRHNTRTQKEITDGTFNNANVSKDTALKIKFYDVNSGENWVTVYYFMDEADRLYFDFAGQHSILEFDYANDQLGSWLSKVIFEDKTLTVYDTKMQAGYVYEKVEGSETEYKKFYFVPEDKKINGVQYKKGYHDGTDANYKDVYYRGTAAIGGILTDLSTKMGNDWNLNVLVNDILSIIKRSSETQMDLVTTIGGFASVLGVSARDAYDKDGNLNIQKILTSGSLGKTLFGSKIPGPVTDANGVTTYSAPINTKSTVLGSVLGMASPLLTTQSVLALEFQEKDNAIQNFSIRADLKNLKTSAGEYPSLTVAINKLQFRGVDQNKTSDIVKMEVAKNQYSTGVNLDLALALDVDGITISPSAITNRNEHFANVKDIVLDGKIVVSLKGKLDLKSKDNKTAAVASIAYQAEGGKLEDLLTATFVGDRLAVKLNQALTVKTTEIGDDKKVVEVPLAETLVACFGEYAFNGLKNSKLLSKYASGFDEFAKVFFVKNDDGTLNKFALNPEFEGGVWDNVDLVSLFQKGVNFVVEKLGGNGLVQFPDEEEGKAKTTADTATVLRQVANTITKAIPLFTTGKDGLTITANNINEVVSSIGKEFDPNMSVDGNVTSITKWDNGNWIEDMAKLLVIANSTYTTDAAKVNVTAADIEMYKNAEREKYAVAYYGDSITQDRINAAKNDYKGKNDDQIRIALASNDFVAYASTLEKFFNRGSELERNANRAAAIAYLEKDIIDTQIANAKKVEANKDKTDAEIRTMLATQKYDNMSVADKDKTIIGAVGQDSLKFIGKSVGDESITADYAALIQAIDDAILANQGNYNVTAIRFVGKTNDEITALVKTDKAFIGELLGASATLRVDMSQANGFVLAINANVADANVGITLTFGASKVDTENPVKDLGEGVTKDSAGWFYFAV